MVPAVTVATQVPALAVSNNSLSVSATSASWLVNTLGAAVVGPFTITGLKVTNNSSTLTASGITVVIDFTGQRVSTFQAPSVSSPWSVAPSSGTASKFTLTYAGTLAPGASVTLSSISFNLPLLANILVPFRSEVASFTASSSTVGMAQGTGSVTSSN